MARQLYLVCDQCKRKSLEFQAINWIETRLAGINAITTDMAPVDGLFCSSDCVVRYFIANHGAKATNPFDDEDGITEVEKEKAATREAARPNPVFGPLLKVEHGVASTSDVPPELQKRYNADGTPAETGAGYAFPSGGKPTGANLDKQLNPKDWLE